MELGMRVIGERRVALRFEKFPESARAKLTEAVTAFQEQLQTAIQAQIPVGKTGAIRDALKGGVESTQYKVRGWVSLAGGDRMTVILPAIALEYGASKTTSVKAKEGRGLKTVYGRYITPMQVSVGAYSRTPNIVAQRFLRGPLDNISAGFLTAAAQAVDAATNEGD